jgi:NAD-dependent deacetylase
VSKSNKKIVVFSGSGMSAESGISTFRDTGGLWEQYRIEEVATPEAWRRDPEMVQSFYNMRRKQILESQPNSAHKMIAELEKDFSVVVITQNIDDLHERAGSKNVLHLHGNITMAKSSGPDPEKKYYPIEGWELKLTDLCEEGYPLRPHVVWFGESVPMYDNAREEIESADVLIVIGTSLQVYPAAGLIHYASSEAEKFLIDPHANELSVPGDFVCIHEEATKGILKCIELLKEKSDR